MKARVYVFLKPKVLDPQGKAIEKALSTLGFEEVKSVRAGKFFEIETDPVPPGREDDFLRAYCKKLLVNAVIEDFRIEVIEK
jgi:phosphoribosylformylglycinamidine synthase subunit PurS